MHIHSNVSSLIVPAGAKKSKKPKMIRAPKGEGPSATEITLRLELQSLEAELGAFIFFSISCI